ncbi:MAG: bifunctional (p)ppGpp synthetase/guanosine-3',5'-bis(diphosphate) 3'-pyrophosphohydrolase [Ardenticatenia bacterium]|nr:bifunctional (p)ppGpp synthetase/guanosine-3',5'-bis(diphosphate) 3'-pyrophosphohydrolase [Ardenticatenia bacterium]
MVTIEQLIEVVGPSLSEDDRKTILRAYEVAARAHAHQRRKTGEPYITHCLETAMIVTELCKDPPVITAALLHDTVEDTDLELEDIRREFGDEVARLVDGVTKLGKINQYTGHRRRELDTRQAENLRKMFLALAQDVRVVFIKLSDRIHNMRTLHALPPKKQLRIARETMEIFAPLANRLGIWQFKAELEDLAFRYLEPDMYTMLVNRLAERREERERYIQNVIQQLHTALNEAGIRAKIKGRPKHLYSIYRKMLRKNRPFEQIYDIHGVRVLVNEVQECYTALGIVHNLWKPIPGEFDDYIATPKENQYQSLHTAVVGPEGKPLEVQIRTYEMDRKAELGVAAHWRYKEELRYRDTFLEERIRWLRSLIEWGREMADAQEFVESVKSDVLPERVLVFTPKGDIKELPAGATPIDFAYAIHTEVGHRCQGARVNGTMVPLNYKLQNGDRVEIITGNRGGPSRDWLNEHLGYVKTQRARSKIRQWFRRQDRSMNIQQGRKSLEHELKRLGLSQIPFEKLARMNNYENVEDFLAAIGTGDLNAESVAVRVLDEQRRKELVQEQVEFELPPSDQSEQKVHIYVQGVGNVRKRLAKCCNPIPGDEIIGYVTKNHWITVHRRDCQNILRKMASDRIVELSWGKEEGDVFPVRIVVRAFDRGGLLRDIADIVARENVNMRSAHATTNKKNHSAIITATLEVKDGAQLARILARIEQLSNVQCAYREVN